MRPVPVPVPVPVDVSTEAPQGADGCEEVVQAPALISRADSAVGLVAVHHVIRGASPRFSSRATLRGLSVGLLFCRFEGVWMPDVLTHPVSRT